MNRLTLAVAVSNALLASTAAFAWTIPYVGTATSGTAASPQSGIVTTTAGTSMNARYVSFSSGAASNKTTPAVQLQVSSNWVFNFSDPAAVSFTGYIYMGNYRTQMFTTSTPVIDGRQSYTSADVMFSGVGSYNATTRTLTYNFMNNMVDGGGASTFQAASRTCQNGATSVLGKICTWFGAASPEWEGLSLSFVFAPGLYGFTGTLRGTDTSGSGFSLSTSTINWQITGMTTPEFPIPASAWLFGSGLLGLGGLSRRRRKSR